MYRKTENSALKHLDFIFLDMAALFLALLAAYGIYNHKLLDLTTRSLYTDSLMVIECV